MASPISAETLTSKLGPLPVWAWGLGAGATIAGARWALGRRRTAAAGTEAPTEATAETIATTGAGVAGATPTSEQGASIGGSSGPGSSFYAADPSYWQPNGSGADLAPVVPTGPVDNQEWRNNAERALIQQGYPPLLIGQAMDGYFSGGRLTIEQSRIVETALRQFGPPPASPPAVTIGDDTPSVSTPVEPAPAPVVAPPPVPVAPAPVAAPQPVRTDYRRDGHDSNQQKLVDLHILDAKNREGRTITYDQSAAELDAFFLSLSKR